MNYFNEPGLEGKRVMSVSVEISIGEFFDKLTILEIKNERINDKEKLKNINKELGALNKLLEQLPFSRDDIQKEFDELKSVNENLWVIEDDIRDKESAKAFDHEFIELARSVYFTNDRRSEIKREINLKLGSDFIEEKSYEDYS
jgi:predicted nuclease with TOPRIM domain